MIPRNTWPHTHHDLVKHYHTLHDAAIESGKYEPWVYPWGTLGATIVILYLLIDHRKRPWLRHARFLVFGVNLLHTIYTVKYVRAKNMAMAMGVGLINVWSSIWVFTILVCYDAQTDFMRIERLEGVFRGRGKMGGGKVVENDEQEKHGKNRTTTSTEEKVKNIPSSISNAESENGIQSKPFSNGSIAISSNTKGHLGSRQRTGEYAWQPYPLTPFIERLDWVLDIFCNFRGAGWNWRPSCIPPPPKPVQLQLIRNSPNATPHSLPLQPSFKPHPFQPHTHPSRRRLLISNLKSLLEGYIALDILKTLIVHDPYFWGLTTSPPAPYLPYTPFLVAHPSLLRIVRLTISQFAILYALRTVFSLGPLVFAGLLGTQALGARGEAWMYPDAWGPYDAVLERGLGGWWSGWWHQTFRFAFEAPSRTLLLLHHRHPRQQPPHHASQPTPNTNPKNATKQQKATQLLTAFTLSALLHATGSHTSHGPTHPLAGPTLFFTLQAVACFLESLLLRPLLNTTSSFVPRWTRRALTFAYVHVWFFFTAGLLCDDFARAGVWLFEPVPVSVFRGVLGLGVEGDSWWVWRGNGVRWYKGEAGRWWRAGVAL